MHVRNYYNKKVNLIKERIMAGLNTTKQIGKKKNCEM